MGLTALKLNFDQSQWMKFSILAHGGFWIRSITAHAFGRILRYCASPDWTVTSELCSLQNHTGCLQESIRWMWWKKLEKKRHLNLLNPFYKYQVACARKAAEFKDSLWLISFKNCNAFISNDEHCLWLCGLLKSNKDVNGLLKTKKGLLLAICRSVPCFSFSFLPLIIGVYIVIKELPV